VGQQLPAAGHDGAGDALELAPDLELLEEGRLQVRFLLTFCSPFSRFAHCVLTFTSGGEDYRWIEV
jgi:hypothetical protein